MSGYILIAALWGFGNFGSFSFGPQGTGAVTETPGTESGYTVAGGAYYLTTSAEYYIPAE
jgi:hypothetical protein